jgi:tryptophan-rich sensory protein
MTTDSPATPLFWRESHRTGPEQFVGLSIYLLIALAFQFFSHLNTFYFLSLAMSMWTLWRLYSLRVLKLEFSLFVVQLTLGLSFFSTQQKLFALVALLLLWCNTLLTGLLFWKKERLSGALLLFPLIWIFYLAGLNMIACISNP